jgi:hypothetical protein
MRASTIGLGAALLLLSGCMAGPGNQRATLAVTMTGIQEVPGPGDPDGSGTVEVRVMPATGQVCWNLYARGIDPATGAHIHRGAAGAAPDIPFVLRLTTPDAAGRSQGCATVDQRLAQELSLRAHEFYVNVHTAAYPAGAIRGQLRGGPVNPRRIREPGD